MYIIGSIWGSVHKFQDSFMMQSHRVRGSEIHQQEAVNAARRALATRQATPCTPHTWGCVHTNHARGTGQILKRARVLCGNPAWPTLRHASARACRPCHASVVVDSCLPERSVPLNALQSRSQELLGQDGFNSTSYLQVLFGSHKGCSVAIKAIFN